MIAYVGTIAKSLTAALVATGVALTDGEITWAEGVAIAIAALAVWAIPNADPAGKHAANG